MVKVSFLCLFLFLFENLWKELLGQFQFMTYLEKQILSLRRKFAITEKKLLVISYMPSMYWWLSKQSNVYLHKLQGKFIKCSNLHEELSLGPIKNITHIIIICMEGHSNLLSSSSYWWSLMSLLVSRAALQQGHLWCRPTLSVIHDSQYLWPQTVTVVLFREHRHTGHVKKSASGWSYK